MISIIVVVAKNSVIGKKGSGLLWHLPADLRHFKELTMSHSIVMGRKTHESIGRALPGRKNIVITRQEDYSAPGCVVAGSLKEALAKAEGDEVFIIGGGEIYEQALSLADKLYVTRIDENFDGDVFFPEIDEKVWELIERKEGTVDEKNKYPHAFLTYRRKIA